MHSMKLHTRIHLEIATEKKSCFWFPAENVLLHERLPWNSHSRFRCSSDCHPVQVIMNRPTIIHTAYPGLLELDHSHSLQVLHINGTLAPIKPVYCMSIYCVYNTWWTVPSISTGTIKSALLMGCEKKQQHINAIQTVGVVPQLLSRGPARNTKP